MSEAPRSPLRPPARRTWLWVLAVVLCCILLLTAHEYFLRSDWGQLADHRTTESRWEHITQGIPATRTDEGGATFAYRILHAVPWVAFCVSAAIFLTIMFVRQRFLGATIAASTFVGAMLTTQAVKHWGVWGMGQRENPDISTFDAGMVDWWWMPSSLPSFPSGHATLTAAAAVAVFLVSAPKQRPALGLFTGLMAAISGGAIFLSSHFPSDILGAYLIVAVWGLIGGWVIMRTGEGWNTVTVENDTYAGGASGLAIFLGIVLTGAALLAYLFAGGFSALAVEWGSPEAPTSPSGWHWVAGVLLSTGPAFLLCGAGILFFNAETGRRRYGHPLPDRQQIKHPIPPNFAHLYEV